MTASGSSRQALILSSGGANGAYEVGVMKALLSGKSPATDYQPLAPETFKGSSIGAFNAAFLVGELEETDCVSAVERLERVWLEDMAEHPPGADNGALRIRGNPFKFLDPRNYISNPLQPFVQLAEDSAFFAQEGLKGLAQFATSSKMSGHLLLNLLDLSTFFSSEPYLRVIKETIRFDKIRLSRKALRIDITNWDTGKLEVFSNQDMTDDLGALYIQASGALPGFFPQVEIGTQSYADAAVLGYAWPPPAIAAGADMLHVIYVDPDIKELSDKWSGSLGTLYRMFLTIWSRRLYHWTEDSKQMRLFADYLAELVRSRSLSKSEARQLDNTVLSFNEFGGEFFRSELQLGEHLDRRITFHLYHPLSAISDFIGCLDFNQDRIRGLIESGYNDAVEHDCIVMGCFVGHGAEP